MNAVTLRLAVIPRTGILTDALLILGGALFLALCAQVSFQLPFTPVPLTLQTFSVLLVGASYGAARGGLTAAVYILFGIVGLPVFADRAHGLDVVLGATGGYLLGFILAAVVVGWLAQRQWDRRFSSAVTAMLTGTSSSVPALSLAATGASFTGRTVTVTVAVSVPPLPSLTV